LEKHLAGIYAEPERDDLRAVFADWLLEQSDEALRERGEFISLQLSDSDDPAAETRAQQLVVKHAASWLGALAAVVDHDEADWHFRRGFLERAAVNVDTAKPLRAVLGAPEWATVTILDVPFTGDTASRLAQAELVVRLPRLVDADIFEVSFYALCRRSERLAVRRLKLRQDHLIDPVNRAIVAAAQSFPQLRELSLHTDDSSGVMPSPDELEWLFEAPLASDLDELRLCPAFDQLGAWLRRIGDGELPLERIVLDRARRWTDRVTVSRDENGAFTEFDVVLDDRDIDDPDSREAMLAALFPSLPDGLTSLVVSGPLREAWRRQIEAEAARFTNLERLELE
jgi:uncharacterized protein (TIGR02996 family)